jgi:Spy/CpxP family protein refolding chaperone
LDASGPPSHDPRWMRLWVGLFALVLFVAGLSAGIVLDRRLAAPPQPPALGAPGPPMGRGMGGPGRGPGLGPAGRGLQGLRGPGMVANRLTRDLSLSEDQRAKVERILDERRARMEQFYGDVRARFETEQRDLRAAIRGVLTPEQQKRFDEWLRWNPLGPPPGGRGGGF